MCEFNLNNRDLNGKLNGTKNVLMCICELIAFVNSYGLIHDASYCTLITKLNNVTQEFLETMEPKTIYLIYIDYSHMKNDEKIEILNVIKNSLEQYDRNLNK